MTKLSAKITELFLKCFERQPTNHTYSMTILLKNVSQNQMIMINKALETLKNEGVTVKASSPNND